MMDSDKDSWFNGALYLVYAMAMVVVMLDLLVWRPN